MATLGSGYAYFKPSVTKGVQQSISKITRTPTTIAPQTTAQRKASLRRGSSSGGGSSSSGSSQPKPQIKTIDPISEIEQIKPTSSTQQKIKTLGNLALWQSTIRLGQDHSHQD